MPRVHLVRTCPFIVACVPIEQESNAQVVPWRHVPYVCSLINRLQVLYRCRWKMSNVIQCMCRENMSLQTCVCKCEGIYICEVTFARLHMRICMCMCSPMGVPAALVGGWSRGGPGHRGEYSGPRCYAAQNGLPECETVQDTQCACSVLEIPERVEWKCFVG